MTDSSAKRKRDNTDVVVDSEPAKVAKPALPSTPEKFPTSQSYDSMVRIKAGRGEKAKVFEVHQGILCFYSGYFRAAFKGRWREAQEGAIDIPSISPSVFKLFIHWAYTRQLEIAAENGTDKAAVQLWIFGDAHEIPMLQNEVITATHRMVVKEGVVPKGFMINHVYENTMPQSRLRQYLIDVYGALCASEALRRHDAQAGWCRDALFDLLQVVWRVGGHREGTKDVEKWDLCKYHVHEQGVKCGES
ncbi:hypothetical protein AC578_4366 [Pseudocercospora eumusae]|uniref:BTB domain-containing protein n=1 Tax=Pseudocercospora eumusae TaxID=321146 RepID=A0A139H639_9PEZI|nr:hypothetical protein AC578_4366 [Pseudocercospora eumusae]